MLHKRYASPFPLLDEMIVQCQFNEWLEHFLNKTAKEENDSMLWEFFLHKVCDKSFTDWKSELGSGSSESSKAMDEASKEKIIKQSQNILNGFNPN